MFDSFGEPAAYAGDAFACVPGGFWSEFEVARTTSCNEVPSLVQSPPMGSESSLWQIFLLFWLRSGRWFMFDFSIDVCEAASIYSGGDKISTEVETQSQSRHPLAAVTRHLTPPNGSAPVPLAVSSRERCWKLLEDAFDKSMYQFRWGLFCGVPWLLLILCSCFKPFQ